MRLFIRGSFTSFQTTRYSQSQLINLLNIPIIYFFRRLRILLKFVQYVKVKIFLVEKERYQNIYVKTVAMNLMILKLRLFIPRINNDMTLVDNTLILMNK